MKKLVTLVIFVGMVVSQTLKIKTPEGSISISIREEEGVKENSLRTDNLIWNIQKRLQIIEKSYLSRLSEDERFRALNLLDEVYFLLSLIPENEYVIIEPIPVVPPVPPQPGLIPMDRPAFEQLITQLKSESFADDKLNLIRSASRKNHFTVKQVGRIVDCFDFEEDKLSAVRILKSQIIDIENSYELHEKFTFSDSKEQLKEILEE